MDKKLTKINHLLIGILILAQPFIVMFQATVVRDVQLFGLSIFESFNIILALVSTCLTIYTYSTKRKFLKYIPYVAVLAAYFLAHGYHIYQFNNVVYPFQSPNFLVESYYIFRTFIVPLLLVFNIYYSGMKKEQVLKILEVFILVIVTVMVVTNIFYIAQRNYSDKTIYNTLNLFDWFTFQNPYKYSYYQLTTKGWFLSGNQMAGILFMSFPVIVYRAYKFRDVFHYILVALQMMAMFMLGTKVSNIGCILIMAMFVMLWLLFKLLKHKEKGIIILLVISIGFAALFPFSPSGYMIKYQKEREVTSTGGSDTILESAVDAEEDDDGEYDSEIDLKKLSEDSKIFIKLNPESLSEDEKRFVKEYMAEYYTYFGISTFILKHYDDLEHSSFWARYIQKTPNNDYRVLKSMILKDIYEKNNNPLDKYLGMGYTLNYIYTESDYTYQLYSYGIFGVLLLITPYFYMLLYVIYRGLQNFRAMFTLESAMYYIAPLLGLCVAKFSGHVLERPFPLITLGMLIGIILIHTRNCVNSYGVEYVDSEEKGL